MSADLWREFGASDPENLTIPPCEPPEINRETERIDLEVPAAPLFLAQESNSWKKSINDASSNAHIHGHLGPGIKGSRSDYGQHPPGPSSPGEYDITEQTLAIGESSGFIRRKSKLSEDFEITAEYSHTPERIAVSKQTYAQTSNKDDEWGDFIEGINTAEFAKLSAVEGSGSPKLQSRHNPEAHARSSTISGRISPLNEEKIDSTAVTSHSSNLEQPTCALVQGPPPSNVPPPSILLPLISSTFQSLTSDFKNSNTRVESSLQRSSATDQPSITKFRRRLSLIRASARIIAGRKLRWSRDGHLSQSMKIGPARGGRAGGMKLTVLDRTETRREDREVEEAIRMWKGQLGNFRASLGAIRTHEFDRTFVIPELAEKMPVRVAKLSDGGITSAKGCFLCGLKRDERVEKVDIQVEDSFGEWWIDHWGHVDCVMFWQEQQENLQQR